MNERERILELMKNGVISTEEGLDLLESLAKKYDRKEAEAAFNTEEKADEANVNIEEALDDDSREKQKEAEASLEQLVSEINQYSVELDTINENLANRKKSLELKKEELEGLKASGRKTVQDEKDKIIEKIRAIQKELELIKQLDDVDTTEEIVTLREEINELDEQLTEIDELEIEESQEASSELLEEIQELEEEVNDLAAQKAELMKKLHRTKMKQWTLKAKQATSKFELPEDWEKKATEELSKAGEKLDAASKEWSKIIKTKVDQASKNDVSETIRTNIERP